MHILIVSQYFWPESFRINDMAQALLARGHQVTVLTGMPSYPDRSRFKQHGWLGPYTERWDGITILRAPLCSRGNGRSIRLLINYLSFACFASLVAPFRCRDQFDVIFAFEPSPITSVLPAILLRKLKKVPLVLWVQDLWPETLQATNTIQSQYLLQKVGSLVKYIYARCDKIWVPAKSAIASITEHYAPASKVDYLPNWAEDFYRVISTEEKKQKKLTLPDGFKIIFAGNIGVSQSFDTILAAAKYTSKQTDIHWVILGEGRMLSWVKQEIKRLGLENNIHLLGRKPAEMMPYYFAHADALLVSLTDDPIFSLTIPSKIQSYLACGKPILASLNGEGGDIITNSQAGFSNKAKDSIALANNAIKLFNLPKKDREQMGHLARKLYEAEFDRNFLIKKIEKELISITSKSTNQSAHSDANTEN